MSTSAILAEDLHKRLASLAPAGKPAPAEGASAAVGIGGGCQIVTGIPSDGLRERHKILTLPASKIVNQR